VSDLRLCEVSGTCANVRIGEVWKRQATRAGLLGAFAALLLWPIHAAAQELARLPFILALVVTAAGGLSILLITVNDILTVRRSRHARPARIFDLVLGAALLLPTAAGLSDLLRP